MSFKSCSAELDVLLRGFIVDLIIRRARLRHRENLVDVGVKSGRIITIAPSVAEKGAVEIDAGGNLVSPPFCDPHVHLDAVLSVGDPRYNQSGTLLEGIAIWSERKPTLTKELIRANALEAIKWEVAQGCLKIRTHADVFAPELIAVEALLELKGDLKDEVDIQVVAFPQDGIYAAPHGEKLMEEALRMGADVVGGIPHNELTREDGIRDLEYAFSLAEKYEKPIDVHCDETGDEQSRFIEVLAKLAIERGFEGRVAASHATAMHNYNNDYAFKLIGILQRAGIHVITNPFDNAVLQNRFDGYPRRRGHTRVDELLARGVNVAIGHDSIMDPWYPLGRGSMLQAANLLLHTAHMSGYAQISQLYDMITVNSARTLGVAGEYQIAEGNTADLIVVNASSEMEAIRLLPECLWVIRRGKVLATTSPARSRVELGDTAEDIDFKRGETQ
ncbi:MAG: cytosine deaminase [Spirochaetaceae bacterium]|nr:MAG: cytosine deaminase [Spirochaetaceae bacterium]